MSRRDYAILYLDRPVASSVVGGGTVVLASGQHRIDGVEHSAAEDSTYLDVSSTAHGLAPKLPGSIEKVFRGDGTYAGALVALAAISPATLTAATANWNPTGLSTAEVVRVATDASRELSGIVAPTTGRALILVNVGSFDLVLAHEDGASSAANRFACPGSADVTVGAGVGVWLVYDLASARWRVVGGTGSALTVKDEGTPLATDATSLDFVGAGVVASGTGAAKTITVSEPTADAHIADTSDAHDASAVSVLDTAGNFSASDVEGALAELAAGSITTAVPPAVRAGALLNAYGSLR